MELVEERAVKIPLGSTDKSGVIRELVDILASTGKVDDAEALYRAVLDRETLGSTGLADGIAVPHGKTGAVRDLAVAVGVSPAGIDFDALDGRPSRLFFLMAAPEGRAGPHIEALAEIARLSHSRALVSALVAARDAPELIALLRGD